MNIIRYIQTHEFSREETNWVLGFTLTRLSELLLFSYCDSLHILIRDHRTDTIISENGGFL